MLCLLFKYFAFYVILFLFCILYPNDKIMVIHNDHKGYNDYIQWIHKGYM